jgi:uncharacterized protein (TIGR01777 family)
MTYNAFMRIFVTGATGLLGSRVVATFLAFQHEVVLASRNATRATKQFNNTSVKIIEADVTQQGHWQTIASECDAIVHLAGAGIVDRRWTKAYKETIRRSRIDSTKCVAEVANNILICASAIGFYGDCGNQQLTEESPAGNDFLSDLCSEWEAVARTAKGRVVSLRFGIILDAKLGALAKMVPLFRFGLGGPIGNGKQYWSWIAWQDACTVIFEALQQNWEGPINVVAPEQVTCKEFVQTLGRVMNKPSLMRAPAFALRTMIGEGSCVLTASQRVIPRVLIDQGFKFQYPTLQQCLVDNLQH